MLNKVMLIGRLGQDPELKYTKSGGVPVTSLNVATDETYTDRDGNRQKITEWHRVVVFQRLAENCCNYLGKGSLVFVEGSLTTRKWQDQNGMDRYTTEIKARNVQFLDRRGDRGAQDMPGYDDVQNYAPYPPRQQNNQGGEYGGYDSRNDYTPPRPSESYGDGGDNWGAAPDRGNRAPAAHGGNSRPMEQKEPPQRPVRRPEEEAGPVFPQEANAMASGHGQQGDYSGSNLDQVPF